MGRVQVTTVVPLAVNHLTVILRDIVTIGLDMEAAVVTHALIDGDGQCVLVDAWKVDEGVEVIFSHDVSARIGENLLISWFRALLPGVSSRPPRFHPNEENGSIRPLSQGVIPKSLNTRDNGWLKPLKGVRE